MRVKVDFGFFYPIQYPAKLNQQARQGGCTEVQVNSVWPGFRGSITLLQSHLGKIKAFATLFIQEPVLHSSAGKQNS